MSAGQVETTTLSVLADSARARLVKRTPAGHFATFAEVDAREGLQTQSIFEAFHQILMNDGPQHLG